MQKKKCFLFGTAFKLHSYKGELNIYQNKNIVIDLSIIKYLLIEINNQLIPFFISDIRYKKPNVLLIHFEDVNSTEEATILLDKDIYIPKKWIKKSMNNEEYLIGYSVLNISTNKNLGEIVDVNLTTPQKIIYVRKNEKEFCFPMHKEFIKNIDQENKTITVNIPDEIINLN